MLHALGRDFSRRGNLNITRFDNQITISGLSGVGTSTALKELQKTIGTMGWRYLSAGTLMRQYAQDEGLPIEEFVARCAENDDEGFDCELHELMSDYARQNFTVIEGRVAHVYAPLAFHVLITCPLSLRASRRMCDAELSSQVEAQQLLMQRDAADAARFNALYPGWNWPETAYDFVFDATSPDGSARVGGAIFEAHRAWRQEQGRLHDTVSVMSLPKLH